MSKNFEVTVALMQLLLLALWEGVGAAYFGWSPVAILICWGAGIFTFNVAIATALRTFLKLTRVPEPVANNVVSITEDDHVA